VKLISVLILFYAVSLQAAARLSEFEFPLSRQVRVDFPEHHSPSIVLAEASGKKTSYHLNFLSEGNVIVHRPIPAKAYEILGLGLQKALEEQKTTKYSSKCLSWALVTWQPRKGEKQKDLVCWDPHKNPRMRALVDWRTNAEYLR
jgi:hypothetical protein